MSTTDTNTHRKLTDRQATRIRELYRAAPNNYSQRDLARMYHVSRSSIFAIVNWHTYTSAATAAAYAEGRRQARARRAKHRRSLTRSRGSR